MVLELTSEMVDRKTILCIYNFNKPSAYINTAGVAVIVFMCPVFVLFQLPGHFQTVILQCILEQADLSNAFLVIPINSGTNLYLTQCENYRHCLTPDINH